MTGPRGAARPATPDERPHLYNVLPPSDVPRVNQRRVRGGDVLPCCIDGCGELVWARGWCRFHYDRLAPRPQCEVPGCDRKRKAKGKCNRHYEQQRQGRL